MLPLLQAQRPMEDSLLGDTPMAAIALAQMGGRGVTGSPQRVPPSPRRAACLPPPLHPWHVIRLSQLYHGAQGDRFP